MASIFHVSVILQVVLSLLNLVGKVLDKSVQWRVIFSILRQVEEFLLLLNAARFDLICDVMRDSVNGCRHFLAVRALVFFLVSAISHGVKHSKTPLDNKFS